MFSRYAGENLFDLVDSVRFIPGTLARQRLGRVSPSSGRFS